MTDTAEAPAGAEPQPWPVNARFGNDFVTQLVLGMSNMTIDEFAGAVAAHVVGKRVPAQDAPMQVVYNGQILDGSMLLGESGIVPLTNVYVDYVGSETVGAVAAGHGAIAGIAQASETLVGPVLRMSDDIMAVIRAIEDDNPDAFIEVVDRGAYVRVQAQHRLRVTRASIERELGRTFELRELEAQMSAFAGRIKTGSDEIVWYLGADEEGEGQ